MKRFALALALLAMLFAVSACAEEEEFVYGQYLADQGYHVYEAGSLLVLMYEAGEDASYSDMDWSVINSADEGLMEYLNSFSRLLLCQLSEGQIYFAAEVQTPIGENGQANGLFSQGAINELLSGMQGE